MSEPSVEKESTSTLGGQAASGIAWMTVQKWAIRLSGFVTIAILTRFLSPEDFGTVAAASTVLPFFFLLADLGFATYVVQATNPDQRTLSTGFWFSAVAGVVLSAILVVLAPYLGAVFPAPSVVPVMQALSLTVVLTGLSSLPMALLRRSMRFKTLALQGAIAAVVAQAVAVVMTLTGFGVWALVGQTLASPAVQCVLAWIAAAWRPSLTFSRKDFVKMTHFGTQVMGVEFVALARAWAEAAIISSALGIIVLGYLSIAQRLVQVVQDMTGAALVPVSMVAFAKIKESMDRLRNAYLRALRMTYAVLAPPLTLLAVAAPVIIPILFGDGWVASQSIAQVLALAGIMVVAATLDHALFYGCGKPGQWFTYALVIDLFTVGMTAFTVQWGLQAVAWGFLVVAGLATGTRWFLVARLLKTTPRITAGPFGFLLVAVLASGTLGWLTGLATVALPSIVQVFLIALVILSVHLLIVQLMARPVIVELRGHLYQVNWVRRLPTVVRRRKHAEGGM